LRSIRKKWLFVLLATCCLGGAPTDLTPRLSAQTLDVQEGPPLPRTVKEKLERARQGFALLNTPVNLKDLPPTMTVKEALVMLYEEVAKQGVELPLVVDIYAIKKARPDLDFYSAPVKLNGLPRRMTAAMFLKQILVQIPGRDSILMLHSGGWVEITTPRAAAARGVRGRSWWWVWIDFGEL
jgi:hypothetical protein